MKTSIIILNWNTLDLLKKCVDSIKEYTKDYELIIIDNGSIEKGTKEYMELVSNAAIYNPENYGFAEANNQGATLANGEFLCFVNSDVVVGKDWLEDLLDTFNTHEDCGAVGPLGNPKTGKVNGMDILYNYQVKGQYKEDTKVDRLIGFCLLLKSDTFKEIGGWESKFEFGNYEDDYLSYKLKSKGLNLWVSCKSIVIHENPGRTFEKNRIDYLGSLEKNKLLFDKLTNG